MNNFRYTIITCNFGGYEIMREVLNPLEDVEYLYITDDRSITSKTWTVIYDDFYNYLENPFDKVVVFRSNVLDYCNSDICIRIDASINICGDSFEKTINEFNSKNADISFIISPRFNTIKTEMIDWNIVRKIPNKVLNQFTNYIEQNGKSYDDDIFKNSICTLGILIQRKDELNYTINQKQISVLDEIKVLNNSDVYYRVDQIVFTYVINEYFRDINVLPLSYEIISNEKTCICIHNSTIPIHEFSVTKYKKLYLFNKEIDKIFNGNRYNKTLTKNDIINNSKKIHINITDKIYNDKRQYNLIKNSYNEWLKRDDVTIIDINENLYYYQVENEYTRYLTNEIYYERVLEVLCNELNIDFNVDDFVLIEKSHIKQYFPKKILNNNIYSPKIKRFNNEYFYIEYDSTNSLYYEDNFLMSYESEENYNETSNYNGWFKKQSKYAFVPVKIEQSKLKNDDDRTLLIISDASIIPFIHILNHYFHTVIIIDNPLSNMNFEFLYAFKNITDVLILSSTNKSLNLIIDNL